MLKLSVQGRAELQEFQKSLDIAFKDSALLNQAFTHSSYVNENNLSKLESNERLEYLGDAVLGLITSGFLYEKYPEYDEGSLTKIKSVLVSKPILAGESSKLNYGKYILLGKGEESTGGRQRESTLSNVFESVLGAYFLDSGLEKAREFLTAIFLSKIDSNETDMEDYKSKLQEVMQAKYKKRPVYVIAGHFGPEHKKIFLIKACFKGKTLGKGKGASKKEAEQEAAKNAIERMSSSSAAVKGGEEE